ncbi:MAG TPA: TlpA disulfide reductase family protein [Thermoanaerobaculia bacterium]|nr:TlpA disulfide reductase family protein [Thermoanaerobaculia bacterium]
MKTRTLLALAFGVALASVGVVWVKSLAPPPSPSGSLAFLSAAPNLIVKDREGKTTDLSKLKGKIFVIHFWATWCPPCVEEIPALSRFWDKYRSRSDVALYAVSVDKDWKTIDAFSAKSPNNLPIYIDPGAAAAKRFGTVQYPETYIVNANGRVLERVPGAVSWDDPEVRKRIEQLLAS